ncbi:MAG: hypothetical protein ACO26I_07670, partial [Burkholderiaceae bacterium]
MKQVLICSAFIVTLSMGIRHGFGLWLQPVTVERGWTRETFAFALAVQNLAWGLAGPLAGMVADMNRHRAGAAPGTVADVQDKQAELVRQLSEIANVNVTLRPGSGTEEQTEGCIVEKV